MDRTLIEDGRRSGTPAIGTVCCIDGFTVESIIQGI